MPKEGKAVATHEVTVAQYRDCIESGHCERPKNLRSSYRLVKPPESGDSVYGSIGFRCVYTARGQG